jgi:hypothetical protein
MSLEGLLRLVLALRGTLVSSLRTTFFHRTFFSLFTANTNCLNNCELYGHVVALVSHLGDAVIVSQFTMTVVMFYTIRL